MTTNEDAFARAQSVLPGGVSSPVRAYGSVGGTPRFVTSAQGATITDGDGRVEEVKGPGVVGQQPYLNPGDQFEYTSGCVLTTPRGEMRGTYQMHRPDGREFDATIAPFSLTLPYSLN